jgi:hypothetical protein
MSEMLRPRFKDFPYLLTAIFGGIRVIVYCNSSREALLHFFELVPSTNLQGSYFVNDITLNGDLETRVILFFSNGSNPFLKQIERNTFHLSGPQHEEAFTRQIPHILYVLTEKVRQNIKRECTAHCAAVFVPSLKYSILILGDKGSGKTNTSYSLCKTYGGQLIGNDLVIVGKNKSGVYAHGGSTKFTMRYEIAIGFFPEISPPAGDETSTYFSLGYENKIEIEPEDHGIKIKLDPSPIGLVVRVNVHQLSKKEVITNRISFLQESLKLHENLSRYIRGQTTPLYLSLDGKVRGYFPSLDSSKSAKIRQEICESLFKSSFNYVCAKSPIRAADMIMNEVIK